MTRPMTSSGGAGAPMDNEVLGAMEAPRPMRSASELRRWLAGSVSPLFGGANLTCRALREHGTWHEMARIDAPDTVQGPFDAAFAGWLGERRPVARDGWATHGLLDRTTRSAVAVHVALLPGSQVGAVLARLESLAPYAVFAFLGVLDRLLNERADARPGLTPREREVLEWICQGKTNWEISRILERSPSTIKIHVHRVFEKLDVRTRAQAAVAAVSCGLLPPRPPPPRDGLPGRTRSR